MSNFLKDEADELKSKIRMHVVKDPNWDLEKRYEVDYSWKERELLKPQDVRTTAEMIGFLESEHGKGVELDAKVLAFKENEVGVRKLDKKGFREAYLRGNENAHFMEDFAGYGGDFAGGNGFSNPNGFGNTVGNDFTPMLGGPFYKQLYYYNDWLKMHQDCFFAGTHDPFGKDSVNIMQDFTIGKGYQVQCSNGAAQALWDAFEVANNFQEKMRKFAYELSLYGEDMFWWLPNKQLYIDFNTNNATGSIFNPNNIKSKYDVPTGLIPRVRLVDPSNFIEIITHPEDIERKIAFVWCTPTQYQIYTAKDEKTGEVVNTSKFIYQQIPAEMIDHFTINNVSNEKRGRSDLFPALPYFKRLRDSVNYSLINQQKNSAWCLDTTVEGDQNDLDAYVSSQQAQGTIPPAGSEFVHTKAIERKYNANAEGGSTGKGAESVFQVGLSMIAAATGIPVSYYGSHLSSSNTRASAIVATEPVAKRFEMRQQIYKQVIEKAAERLFRTFKIKSEIDVNFPEIVTQDRTAKLKDLFMAEQARWISPQRAATTAAKELGADKYDYDQEMADIKSQSADEIPLPGANPLTSPGSSGANNPGAGQHDSESAITSAEKKDVNDSRGY